MLHNQFDIDNSWTEGTIRSAKGDVAQVRMNSLTKEVYIRTRVGDGNAAEWRKTNSTYEAMMAQGFAPHSPDQPAPAREVAPAVEPVAAVPQVVGNGHKKKVEPLDLQSVQPLGHTKIKPKD